MDDYERVHELEDLLDPSTSSLPSVNNDDLRRLCAQGIPDDPSWIRTRAWKLLLELIPPDKSKWDEENENSKTRYWALVDGVAEQLAKRPTPTRPMSYEDRTLADLAFSLPSLPLPPESVDLNISTQSSPAIILTTDSPSNLPKPNVPTTPFKYNTRERPGTMMLLSRLAQLMTLTSKSAAASGLSAPPPTLTISFPDDPPPPPSPPTAGPTIQAGGYTPSVLAKKSRPKPAPRLSKSERKALSLLRILHTHVTLHPSHPPITQLLPLTTTLYLLSHSAYYPPTLDSDSEGESEAVVTEDEETWDEEVEAEAFWFLEGIRDRMGEVWIGGEAMDEILRTLESRLARIDEPFANELARKSLDPSMSEYSVKWVSSVLSTSLPPDALLLTYDVLFALPTASFLPALVDVLIALLILLRPHLFAAGRAKGQAKTANLWGGEEGMENEEEAKREGEAMLERYPIDEVTVDRVLRAAYEIRVQREWEERMIASGWTADAVRNRLLGPPEGNSPTGTFMGTFRGFAETLKQSDTAASFAKVSTNWRASAMQAWGQGPSTSAARLPGSSPTPSSRHSSWGSAAGMLWGSMRGNAPSPNSNGDARSPSSSVDWNPSGSRASSQSPQARSDYLTSPMASAGSFAASQGTTPGSPSSAGRSLPSLQAALNSIINAAPAPSPLTSKKPPPKSLMLSASARPPSIQKLPQPRTSHFSRQNSMSSTVSTTSRRTASLSAASDSDGGVVRLRSGVSPRSPAGMALRQKREFSSSDRPTVRSTSLTMAPNTVLSPDSYMSSPPLPTPPPLSAISPAVSDAIHKWTVTESPISPVITRSSSNSSLGSEYQAVPSRPAPVPSPGLRKNRRISEKKPPGLRICDPKSAALPNLPLSPTSTTDEEALAYEDKEDTLLPYARQSMEDGERTPEPRTPRPSMIFKRSPSPAIKREAKKKPLDGVMSEEEGVKADEEDNIDEQGDGEGYGEILSAYEE